MNPSLSNLTPNDLAELMAAFNDVTTKLEASHDHLRAEVARLTTELHEANEAVARAQRLAALGEMAAGIAHEIRNPLGGIRLYARMLEQDLAHQPEQAGIASKITSSARAVEQIVHDVLAFAKELRLRQEPMDASEMLDKAVEAVVGQSPQSVKVRRDYASAMTIEVDAHLLHQALVNIIQNAVQAMQGSDARALTRDSAGGQVARLPLLRLSLREQRVTLTPGTKTRTRCAVLRIQDSGPGVTPEVIDRMFNPFFTTRASGTGLGLAIVHRIVDAHSGRVVVRNNSEVVAGGAGGAEWAGNKAETADGSCLRGACVDVVVPMRAIAKQPASRPVHGQIGHEASVCVVPARSIFVATSVATSAATSAATPPAEPGPLQQPNPRAVGRGSHQGAKA